MRASGWPNCSTEAHNLPEKRAKSRLNRVGKEQRLQGKKLRGAVKAGRGKVSASTRPVALALTTWRPSLAKAPSSICIAAAAHDQMQFLAADARGQPPEGKASERIVAQVPLGKIEQQRGGQRAVDDQSAIALRIAWHRADRSGCGGC